MARRDALRLGLSRPGLLEEAFGRRDHRSRHYQSAARIVGRLARSVEILVSVPCVIFEDDHLLAVNKPAGQKYVARPPHAGSELAETCFRVVRSSPDGTLVEAEPLTGKTHQIRVHAAASGFPILGDTLYGGAPAARVHLHAQELTLRHPA